MHALSFGLQILPANVCTQSHIHMYEYVRINVLCMQNFVNIGISTGIFGNYFCLYLLCVFCNIRARAYTTTYRLLAVHRQSADNKQDSRTFAAEWIRNNLWFKSVLWICFVLFCSIMYFRIWTLRSEKKQVLHLNKCSNLWIFCFCNILTNSRRTRAAYSVIAFSAKLRY